MAVFPIKPLLRTVESIEEVEAAVAENTLEVTLKRFWGARNEEGVSSSFISSFSMVYEINVINQ